MVLSNIQDVVKSQGYELLEVENFGHKDDYYLKVIVAKNEKEYVCWLYNDNDKAVYEGYYTKSYQEAYDKMMKRIS